MKHVTVEGKEMIVGDEVADALTAYAAAIAKIGSGDRVDVRAFSTTGDETTVTVVFTAATSIVAETVHSSMAEPDNTEATAYLREHTDAIMSPLSVLPESSDEQAWNTEMDEG